jgi:hypothetical protein
VSRFLLEVARAQQLFYEQHFKRRKLSGSLPVQISGTAKEIMNSVYFDFATFRIKTQKPSSSHSRIRGFSSLITFSQFPRVNRQKNVAVIGGRIKKKSSA